jgi:hypothetical protein
MSPSDKWVHRGPCPVDTRDVREQMPGIHAWLAVGLALASLAGCRLWPVKPACQDDPLLLAKKAVAGTESAPFGPLLLAQAEPFVPPLPSHSLVANPEAAEKPQVEESSPPVPSSPEPRNQPDRPSVPSPRLQAFPASRSRPAIAPEGPEQRKD